MTPFFKQPPTKSLGHNPKFTGERIWLPPLIRYPPLSNQFWLEDRVVYLSPTPWAWVWVNSGSWWWTGRPGVLRFMGLQRVGHDWATELNWTELKRGFLGCPPLFQREKSPWTVRCHLMSSWHSVSRWGTLKPRPRSAGHQECVHSRQNQSLPLGNGWKCSDGWVDPVVGVELCRVPREASNQSRTKRAWSHQEAARTSTGNNHGNDTK